MSHLPSRTFKPRPAPLACAAVLACAAALPARAARAEAVTVTVANPLAAPRASETVAVSLAELRRLAPGIAPAKMVVVGANKAPVLSQLVDVDGDETPDEIVFQTDLGARETKTFTVEAGERHPAARDDFRVYGRFARERHDDFAWENDRIAHRVYGPDLETWRKEPLTSSGIDVWVKRTRKLIVNDWYLVDDYHRDKGEGADFYSVGKSRGCGGDGIWAGDKLFTSRNFVTSRVLANGPIRLVFELDYAPWDAGTARVSETKRVTLDAGANFNRIESRFKLEGPTPAAPPGAAAALLDVGVGIAKHEGAVFEADKSGRWMRSWEPLKPDAGHLGCAVILPGVARATYKQTDLEHLLVAGARPGVPFVAYAGIGWDRAGDGAAPDAAAWAKTVERRAHELAAPVKVTLAVAKGTAQAPATEARRWAVRAADAVIERRPVLADKWSYDAGLVLSGVESVWRETGDRKYLDYVKANVDRFVGADGVVQGYARDSYNLDEINMGKVLFALYADAKDAADKERYHKALALLRAQLTTQPRTADGGFWHKQIYPHQMWLDGVYMASPFLARYAKVFGEPAAMDEAARQVLLAEKHLRDPRSGLLRHGWDEQRASRWANPETGASPEFWGRGMGWYAMAVVDVLGEMPRNHPQRAAVLAVLRRLAPAVAKVQDRTTGVWWQVLDAGGRAGNYREASASAMFVYALSKGVANGWLDAKTFAPAAALGYAGVLNQFVVDGKDGRPSVTSICKVAGLGGTPYRDGSYAYYVGTEVVTDDPKGVGAFILASAARG
jgi:unsaturated rhamnogalacturonyl hydrolase